MVIEILMFFVCVLASAFFSATETAFISLPRIKFSQFVERNLPAAKLAQKLKNEPSKLISIILVGNNIVNTGATVLGADIVIRLFEDAGAKNVGLVLGAATAILTLILLMFCDVVPKTVAIRRAETLVLVFSWPIYIISIILTPLEIILKWIAFPFVRILGGKMPEYGAFITEEDLRFMISASEKEGVIEREEREMISSIFEFGETSVKEVMTPRPDIAAVEDSVPIEDVFKKIKETGHSRIPVYENNIDNIVGVIYSKDLLEISRDQSLRDFMRSVIFIPEGKMIHELLHQMQANRTHIAVVVDEYGVTSGIVTMEDLIEEIVGEIHDEFERAEKNLEKISENTYLIDGKMLIEDVNSELSIDIPVSEKYDRIAGFVFETLDKMPSVGDVIKYDDVEISVEKVLRRRITRLKIIKLEKNLDENAVGG
ncbi:HlyC/CorC family transporter [Candidatus Saganbacteria bacterium]|nr:HlyC/CorC family transporter [Candidatus Saganbacteria bacterium]